MNEILLIFMNFCPRIGDEDIVVVGRLFHFATIGSYDRSYRSPPSSLIFPYPVLLLPSNRLKGVQALNNTTKLRGLGNLLVKMPSCNR